MLHTDSQSIDAPGAAVRIADQMVRLYQAALSPLLGPHCLFAPSCSMYARHALRRHGVRRGSWLALRRVLRCHPWHPGGWDPVD